MAFVAAFWKAWTIHSYLSLTSRSCGTSCKVSSKTFAKTGQSALEYLQCIGISWCVCGTLLNVSVVNTPQWCEAMLMSTHYSACVAMLGLPSVSSSLPLSVWFSEGIRVGCPMFNVTAISTPDIEYDGPFTFYEMERALSPAKDTAPSNDGIKHHMLMNMDEEGVNVAVLDLINQVYKIGRIPEKSRMAEITPIPKANRPNSSRPISLLEVISKLKERMVKPRLKHKVGDLSEVILGYTDRVGPSEVLPTTISEISESPHGNTGYATGVPPLVLSNVYVCLPVYVKEYTF